MKEQPDPPGERERPEIGRAFVAVRPPEPVLDAVAAAIEAGRPPWDGLRWDGLRWEGPDHWHLTVQFLGPVARLAPVTDALAAAVAGRAAFPFRLGGAGAFPTVRRARVVWVGASEGEAAMVALAGAVNAALAEVGYEVERRAFRPHVTLARLKVPGDVGSVLAAIGAELVGPSFRVEEVLLYQSRLSGTGATYSVLGRFPLNSAGGA